MRRGTSVCAACLLYRKEVIYTQVLLYQRCMHTVSMLRSSVLIEVLCIVVPHELLAVMLTIASEVRGPPTDQPLDRCWGHATVAHYAVTVTATVTTVAATVGDRRRCCLLS